MEAVHIPAWKPLSDLESKFEHAAATKPTLVAL